jgi:predicted membrane-bound mannosyltransferase
LSTEAVAALVVAFGGLFVFLISWLVRVWLDD